MADLPYDEWDNALFDELQHLLTRIANQPTTSTVRRFTEKLEDAVPWILALAAIPGPSEQDKQAVEKNPLTLPSGSTIEVKGDLLNTTNQISTLLGVSQRLAVVLVLQSEELRSRYPSRNVVEIATYTLHNFLSGMLSFLHELLRLTLSTESEPGQVFDSIREWVKELLVRRTSLGAGKGEGSLVDQILLQVDELQGKIRGLVGQRAVGPEYELLAYRVKVIRSEQVKVAGILGLIAQSGMMGRGHLVKILKWLMRRERVGMLEQTVLGCILAVVRPIDALDPADPRYDMVDEWCRDIKFLKIASNLVFLENWSDPRLREVVRLPWALFILSTLRHDPTAAQVGIDPPTAEQYLLDGVTGEAFQYLHHLVMTLRVERGLEDKDESNQQPIDTLLQLADQSDTENDMFFLRQLQDLLEYLAVKKHFVRNLRNKEEDTAIRRTQPGPPAMNFQAFMALLAVVYKSLPGDSAKALWEDPSFIGTVLDQRSGWPSIACWDMLRSMSTGPECSALAYERTKDGRLSWNSLSKFYQHYYEILPHIFEPIKTSRTPTLEPMGYEDAEMCKGWTRFITEIAKGSSLARQAMLQAKPSPVQMLCEFLNCDVTIDIKAVIVYGITAFCERSGDPSDEENIMRTVECYERVTYVDPGLDTRSVDSAKIPAPVGWLAKMEYSEQDIGSYPLTRAYLSFLTSLLPDPLAKTASRLRPRVTSSLRRSAFYVMDRVFMLQGGRRYIRESERWEVIDAALAFMERALLVFDMSDLLTQTSSRSIASIVSDLYGEPGFVVLLRLLSDSDPFNLISSLLDNCSSHPTPRPRHVNDVLLRILRICHRIFDIQLIFCDVLILALTDTTRSSSHPFRRPLNMVSLDQMLLTHLSNVNAVALLVGDDDLTVSFIATKLMSALMTSPLFGESDRFLGEYSRPVNRLAGIIDVSDDSIRISQGFYMRLNGDGADLTPEEDQSISKSVLKGDAGVTSLAALPLTIRSSILDLLLAGTAHDANGPNLAHFLLGYDFKGRTFSLQDSISPHSRLSCLTVLLDQMTGDTASTSLVSIHPILASKSAQLMHQLFSHSITAQATISYTTSTRAFAAYQLLTLPRQCPPALRDDIEGIGMVILPDSEVLTTADTLVAYLDFQRSTVSCVALETHSFDGRGPSASAIAELLFNGTGENIDDADEDQPGQRPPLIIDLLKNIDLIWKERLPSGEAQAGPPVYYEHFDFDKYKRADVEWWDLTALKRGMDAHRRNVESRGQLSSPNALQAMEEETASLLARLAVYNRETDISLAKGSFLTAWSETLKVAIGQLFNHIAEDRQEVVLIELLFALLDRIHRDISPGVCDILSESILVAMGKLVQVMAEYEGQNAPVDQLIPILSGIIDAISSPKTTESARGNLYATLNQFLSLLVPTPYIDDAASVAASSIGHDSLYPSGSGLRRATLMVLNAQKEKLFTALCSDAMDVRDVWKTECFALLAAVVGACHNDKDRSILSPLTKDGWLPLFVRSLKDREIPLMECLGPDAASSHAYWVYESKMTFLLAYASTRTGAENLLDAGLFEVLAMCGFVSAQSMSEETELDKTAEAALRQHRVVICALQLVTRALSSLHRSARSGAGHALGFLNAHRDSMIFLLRENQQNINLIGIEECQLIVSLLSLVRHKVPEEDIHNPSAFGAFHMATLAVAARFFDADAWTSDLIDDTEANKAKLRPAVMDLNQVLLAYLTAATAGLKTSSGYPVLVNGAYRVREAAKYIPTAPSIHTTVQLLADLTEELQDLSGEYQDVVDRLIEGGNPDPETLKKLNSAGIMLGPNLTEDSAKHAFAARGQQMFNMIESIMLLLWRHLLFYANDVRGPGEAVRPDNLSLSLAPQSVLDNSRSAVGAMRSLEKVAAMLRGVLQRVMDLDVHGDMRRTKGNDAYFGMLLRRLQELTAGLTGIEMDA